MKKLITAALCLAIMATLCSCNRVDDGDSESRFSVSDYRNDVSVITDTETGVQYLLAENGYGAGLTTLVDADGKPMIAGGKS